MCGFVQGMQKIIPCFYLNLEISCHFPIFFPVESELQKCVISLAWLFRCCCFTFLIDTQVLEVKLTHQVDTYMRIYIL